MAPKSILVVDDEPLICDILRELLNSYEHRVEIARNGETALQLSTQFPYDLIITDFRMPGINGLQLAQRIRRRASHPDPLSAPQEQLHVDAILTKPFSFEELEAAMLEIFRAG